MAINRDKYKSIQEKLDIAQSQLPNSGKFSIDVEGCLCIEDGTQVVEAKNIDEVFDILAAWVGKK